MGCQLAGACVEKLHAGPGTDHRAADHLHLMATVMLKGEAVFPADALLQLPGLRIVGVVVEVVVKGTP
jgi:hypothetical protein